MPTNSVVQMQSSVSVFVDSGDFATLRRDMESFDAQRENIIKRSRGMLYKLLDTLPLMITMAFGPTFGSIACRHPEAGEAGDLCSAPQRS